MDTQSNTLETAVSAAASQGAFVTRLLRVASLGIMGLSLAMANLLPATAAEPAQVGPAVIVTASRTPEPTPGELTYLAAAHRKLQGASRYPSGREASLSRPSGTTTVWAEVSQDGRVVARSVAQSSGTALLDNMAKSLVGRTRFPAFAANDWGDAPTQRFVVSYRFEGDAMTGGASSLDAMATLR